MANIVATNVMSGHSTSTASSYNTASVSPTSGRVHFLAVASGGGSTRNTPTVTGASMTWTQVTTLEINGFVRLTVFRTYSTSPGSGALTIDFDGQNQDRCAWILDNFTETRVTGTNASNAVVQSNGTSGSSASTVSTTLSAFASVDNATYGACVTQNSGIRTITAGTGFTELDEEDTGDNIMALATMFRNDNDTSVDFTASASSTHLGVIGVELANLSTEFTGGYIFFQA